jgi:hypothetical protein
MTAPSRKATSEWTMLSRWTTASSRSGGTPNSQRASISSKPLFIMVAESTVILRPIRQLGCFSASAAVLSAVCAAVRPKNGPPDAVTISFSTSSCVPARRH